MSTESPGAFLGMWASKLDTNALLTHGGSNFTELPARMLVGRGDGAARAHESVCMLYITRSFCLAINVFRGSLEL